jgi:rhamnogalacturonyl hydrolase YesR
MRVSGLTVIILMLSLSFVVAFNSVSSADPETPAISLRSLDKSPVEIAKSIADRYMRMPSIWDNYMGVAGMMPPEWGYPTGVVLWSLLELADFTGETKYRDYVRDCFKQYLDRELIPGFGGEEHRDKHVLGESAMMMSAGQELHRRVPDSGLEEKIDEIVDYFRKVAPRTPDGTYCYEIEPERNRIWIDAVFQVSPMLAQYATDKNQADLYDEAVYQILSHTARLMDPKVSMYYQGWGWGIHPTSHSPGFWSRGNGWMALSFSEVLEELPADHPKREVLLKSYQNFLDVLIYHQDTSGLWHQLIDRQDSYEETSGSAMFIFSIARAVQTGLIDKKHGETVKWGMEGLKFQVDPEGIIWGTCVGTGSQNTLEDYYGRPAPVNDYHGIGPVILACIEAARMGIK